MKTKTSNIYILTHISIILLLILLLTSTSNAESNIYIQPSYNEIIIGNPFTLFINVTPGQAIAGVQSSITYNSNNLRIDSIKEGNLFNRNINSFFTTGNTTTINNITIINDITTVILGKNNTTLPGTFIEINATALSKSLSSINLTNTKIGTSDVKYESFTSSNTNINIIYPSYDVNEDGIIDLLDLLLVSQHFGESTSQRWETNKMQPVDILDSIIVANNIKQ